MQCARRVKSEEVGDSFERSLKLSGIVRAFDRAWKRPNGSVKI